MERFAWVILCSTFCISFVYVLFFLWAIALYLGCYSLWTVNTINKNVSTFIWIAIHESFVHEIDRHKFCKTIAVKTSLRQIFVVNSLDFLVADFRLCCFSVRLEWGGLLMCPPSWILTLHSRSFRKSFSLVACLQWVLSLVTLTTTLSLKQEDSVVSLTRLTAALTLILCGQGYKSAKHIANLEFRGISTKCRKLKTTTRNNGVNKKKHDSCCPACMQTK